MYEISGINQQLLPANAGRLYVPRFNRRRLGTGLANMRGARYSCDIHKYLQLIDYLYQIDYIIIFCRNFFIICCEY